MRVPRDVADTLNAYLAFRAALRAVIAHNASDRAPIRTVLCPGLATAIGKDRRRPRAVRSSEAARTRFG